MGTTLQQQLHWLNEAPEADVDPRFPGGVVAFCSLPRTDQGILSHFVHANCTFTLAMIAVGTTGFPCGNLPGPLLAWVCTEAVRTGRRVLVFGNEFRDSMARLGIYATDGYGRPLSTLECASDDSAILLRLSEGDCWASSLPKSLHRPILRLGLWLPPAARLPLDPLGRRKPAARTLSLALRAVCQRALPMPPWCGPALGSASSSPLSGLAVAAIPG